MNDTLLYYFYCVPTEFHLIYKFRQFFLKVLRNTIIITPTITIITILLLCMAKLNYVIFFI